MTETDESKVLLESSLAVLIHEIACPSENELYVTEAVNWRVQKWILHPEKLQTQAD